jgi:membrane-bound lytic murein transglycosylase A
MNFLKTASCLLLVLFGQGCDFGPGPSADQIEVSLNTDWQSDGKRTGGQIFKSVFNEWHLSDLQLPAIDGAVVDALEQQYRLLKSFRQRRNQKVGNLQINLEQLERVVLMLREWQYTYPFDLADELQAYQLRGSDSKGNVRYTGYFTPAVKVSSQESEDFRFPIYRKPENWVGPFPSRQLIDGPKKVLKDRGLEIAYAADLMQVYFMQLQGSGMIQFPNGRQEYLGYDGTNRHPFRSLARYLQQHEPDFNDALTMQGISTYLNDRPAMRDSVLSQNPSYTFFKPLKSRPLGAGNVSLTAGHSIAVDTRYIPLGSVLLAEIPKIGKDGKVVGFEYRYLFAQDTGGQVDGPGHVDLYFGEGEEGAKAASAMHHFGRLFLLLAQPRT